MPFTEGLLVEDFVELASSLSSLSLPYGTRPPAATGCGLAFCSTGTLGLTRGLAKSLEAVGLFDVRMGMLGCGLAGGFDLVGSDIIAGLFFGCGGSLGPISGEEGDAEGRLAPEEGKEGPMMRGLVVLLLLPEGREGPISLLAGGCFVISNDFFTPPVVSTASLDGLVIS